MIIAYALTGIVIATQIALFVAILPLLKAKASLMTFEESVQGVAQNLSNVTDQIEAAIRKLPAQLGAYDNVVQTQMILPGTPLGDLLTSINSSAARLQTITELLPSLIPATAAQLADSFTFTADVTTGSGEILNISHDLEAGMFLTSGTLALGTTVLADAAAGGSALLSTPAIGTLVGASIITNDGNLPDTPVSD